MIAGIFTGPGVTSVRFFGTVRDIGSNRYAIQVGESSMKAVILAAGSATRLRPLTEHRPKCLLEVAGQPILKRLLDQLAALGVDGAVIVLGYRGDQIRDAIAVWQPALAVTFVENREYASTNNGYS